MGKTVAKNFQKEIAELRDKIRYRGAWLLCARQSKKVNIKFDKLMQQLKELEEHHPGTRHARLTDATRTPASELPKVRPLRAHDESRQYLFG